MKTTYTEMNSLEQKEFITRIINCLCCSPASFEHFMDTLKQEEIRCKNEGNLAIINPQTEKE